MGLHHPCPIGEVKAVGSRLALCRGKDIAFQKGALCGHCRIVHDVEMAFLRKSTCHLLNGLFGECYVVSHPAGVFTVDGKVGNHSGPKHYALLLICGQHYPSLILGESHEIDLNGGEVHYGQLHGGDEILVEFHCIEGQTVKCSHN